MFLGGLTFGECARICPAIETLSPPLPPGTDRGCVVFWRFTCAMPMTPGFGPGSFPAPLEGRGIREIRSPEADPFTIASHVIHQHAVRRTSESVSIDIAEVFSELRNPASDEPPEQAAHAQQIDELEHMLALLPARVATALVLHRVAGYSVQEVGDELGDRARPRKSIWPEQSNTQKFAGRREHQKTMRIRYTNGKTQTAVVAEASEWFIEFRAGDVNGAARLRFIEWLRRSPEHIQAYLEVSGAWSGLPSSDPDGRLDRVPDCPRPKRI